MATPEQINENKRRQAYLRSLGYSAVPQDGSWGTWQENLWRRATTREKQYPVSPLGLLQRGWDTITGNTTYRVEHPEGEIRQAPKKEHSNLATAGAVAVTAGGRSTPYGIISTIPLAIGSALVLGNGPEIMRVVNNAGESMRSSIRSLVDDVVSKFDSEDREVPSQPTTASTSAQSASSTGAPKPPEEPDSTSNKRSIRDLLWRRSGKPSSGKLSKLKPSRATVENYGVRLPLYTGIAAPIVDLGLNAIGRAYTPDSVPYTMKFPLTKARFALERGALGLIGDAYKETPSNNPNGDTAPANPSALPAGFRSIQGINDATGQIVGQNAAGTRDTTITIEPLNRSRFNYSGNNKNK